MTCPNRPKLRRLELGVTLIELMVALAIGAFLMIGAVTVFLQARQSFRLTESVARLQETGRFALDALEPEIRMAHYWGLTAQTAAIEGRAGPTDANGLGPDNCGKNWTIDFDRAVEASNNGYTWGPDCPAGPAGGNGASATSDTLVVRRVSEHKEEPVPPATLKDDTLYLQTRRGSTSRLFIGTSPPAEFLPISAAAPSETRVVLVTGFYVGKSSALGANMPSLRRKVFTGDTSGNVGDEEVLPGVEDMQIQFGVDTDPIGADNRGSIDRYVNPGDPIITPGDAAYIPDAEILAVRIWLRIRAENPETGYEDTRSYVYADQDVAAPHDAYRRVLISKTIYLRNARPAA